MGRGAILAAMLFGANLGAADAQTLRPSPPQPAGLAWPTAAWASAALPGDVERASFDLAITEAFAGPHPQLGETRAVLIVQGGRIVFERYGENYHRDMALISWSMAKSITQALVGAAVLEGRVQIEAPMGSPFWRAGDRRASIPWRQWLNMVDGQEYNETGAASVNENDAARMLYGPGRADTARFGASLPLIHDPGAHWNYTSAGYAQISAALTSAVAPDARGRDDRRRQMRAWMDEALFRPIGMHPVVEFDPRGVFYGSSLIYATARDFARFGYLYLRGGMWDGRRVLPAGWVDFARSRGPDPNADIYGAGWWLTPVSGTGTPYRALLTNNALSDAYSAQGHEGQIIVVVPSKDLVMVRLGLLEDNLANWDVLGDWAQAVVGSFADRAS